MNKLSSASPPGDAVPAPIANDTTAETTAETTAASPPNQADRISEAPAIQATAPEQPKASGQTFQQGVLFNIVIPLLLLAGAGVLVVMLGTVTPGQRDELDTTRVGRLRALPPVRVEKLLSLAETGAPLSLAVDGTVVPYRESRVAAEIAGRIVFKSEQCEAGAYVQEGQLLMKIDPTDYELEVERLTRQREQDYQALREVDQEMVNARRQIEVSKKDVELQQKEVDRQKAMPAGFASRAEIDQANRALLASTQQLVGYENQLELLAQRRIRLESSEKLAETQLRAAEINLKRTEIRAPIQGVIVSEEADLNTFVARGATLVVIDDTSKVDVASSLRMDQLYWVLDQETGKIDAADLDPSARGYDLPETPAMIEYELAGREDVVYRWKGRLLSFDGIGLDPVTRTVPVRVVVDDPQSMVDANGQPVSSTGAAALVRGMYVRVRLLIEPKTPLVVIPARALQPGNRVYHFMPDESVLDAPAAETEPETESETESGAEAATKSVSMAADPKQPPAEAKKNKKQGDGPKQVTSPELANFEPDNWQAGKIIVRSNVMPVDSLSILGDGRMDAQFSGDSFSGESSDASLDRANRMWVCEVRDELLVGGSMVVVSPLGAVNTGSMPARARKTGVDGKEKQLAAPESTSPGARPSVAEQAATDQAANDQAAVTTTPNIEGSL